MDRTVSYSTLDGQLRIPPSKSALHRQLIATALACRARQESPREHLSALIAPYEDSFRLSDDIQTTISALQDLMHSTAVVNCGRSGTTLRLLIPVAAAIGGETLFKRDAQLAARPIDELLDQLRDHGCEINVSDEGILVRGHLRPGRYELPGNVSSQYISGLLFALPLLQTDSEVIVNGRMESLPYVEMTIDTLSKAGIYIGHEDIYNPELTKRTLTVMGGQKYSLPPSPVEGDWSLASYWLTANGIMRHRGIDAQIKVMGLNPDSFQGDKRIVSILEKILDSDAEYCEIDLTDIPDLGPILAVAAAAAKRTVRFAGARRLHYKESDRVLSTVSMIRALGGEAEEQYTAQSQPEASGMLSDAFVVRGTGSLCGGAVDTCGDHRIAMAASIAELICNEPVVICDSEVVDKSYPDFYDKLDGLIHFPPDTQ